HTPTSQAYASLQPSSSGCDLTSPEPRGRRIKGWTNEEAETHIKVNAVKQDLGVSLCFIRREGARFGAVLACQLLVVHDGGWMEYRGGER
ncbi:hypothetical protein ACCT14_34395, partial [Rhizobium brockwellii]|uniref:hypothetical protein n=1 Tax=Rhizobium brockwellii TaxID=3019932 RepID=UPI003F9D0202